MSGTLGGSRHENLAQHVEVSVPFPHLPRIFHSPLLNCVPRDAPGFSRFVQAELGNNMGPPQHGERGPPIQWAAAPADFEEVGTWLTLFSKLPPRLEEICDPTHHSTRFPKDRRSFGQKVPLR
ncbi:hypothetical protein PABG_06299 [Paracoccidioides brasiliensis Pb03]|nr:hypothetical protein PABG_06299 [Paracoccidioides brasiliensis Pb03]